MYALILIDLFPRKIEEIQWLQLLESIEGDISPSATTKKIFDSAWLIDLNSELTFFCDILAKVQAHGLAYKVSFFDNKPNFTN